MVLLMTGCAAAPPPAIAFAECIDCAALPMPSSSVDDTAETRRLMDVVFAVWACACAREIAETRGISCAN